MLGDKRASGAATEVTGDDVFDFGVLISAAFRVSGKASEAWSKRRSQHSHFTQLPTCLHRR